MNNNSIQLLLVDDDAEYVGVIKHHLYSFQKKRFEIIWVNNSNEALEKLKSGLKIDLILMDYYLPSTTGVDLIKRIFNENIKVPIILLTSSKDFRVVIEAMKYGVEDYLVKEEAVDTILPRTIISVLDRIELNKQIACAEKDKLIAQKKMEAIQELVVTMCHEFNNPLAAIKISTDILLRQSGSDEEKSLLTKLTGDISQIEKQIIKLRDLNIGKQS